MRDFLLLWSSGKGAPCLHRRDYVADAPRGEIPTFPEIHTRGSDS